MSCQQFLIEGLAQCKSKHIHRSLTINSHLIDFTSNDYLGFASSPELRREYILKLSEIETLGATGSRLLTGHSELCQNIEEKLALYHNFENCLIFNTGYTANLGLLYALAKPQDRILHDLYIHASIYDGIRLSRAKSFPFYHNNLKHLERRLASPHPGKTFVCVESVYSLHGSIAPLKAISELCEKYSAFLIVDEAHAIGVFGEQGEGLVSSLGLQNKVLATVYAFGKALGTHGAAIAGSSVLKDYLINFCRPFIYTTAQPPHALTAIDLAYEHNKLASSQRNHLYELIRYFRRGAQELSFQLMEDNETTPIQSICISGSNHVRQIALKIQELGCDVRPIVSPTVRQKEELLRICLHAFNTKNEVDLLLYTLQQVCLCNKSSL
ncbi:8-amino-7-oxononanoate synthase,8-amino-7-oxononanoate synthase,7-keto-8-aminopelargonate synthetase and related enzymes,8-amino-7-oxononanoate synthase,Aminotransferase class I and II [Chlamydia serpentis]|uniref:8-amino-7-oxononanoate synthase,8-amino-7-oxononanoate synthase,7-keto-8-aminopelargonate synthetase and related enzymes,8-amino-7-oxononanoate synthase,Aminotransferase class I and II n=1 Tax=Chlamydia serpentis TaxID=1967782 RepID=A0A2R8FCM3_9CHLA|nr:pyridoxal phosphate-dependent aminotransferase family protein [Chlamydia serpentis]SPN74148.1 8-amino-7-oxononanoate synthase,8-amino-7-oxononanoate synthase,7-keto-8-aminopelargonate synthetase and related enzymes,8-amino-7-oxononanoate synthase,Aminotransferase class I and II [Chlamydia serpentis]